MGPWAIRHGTIPRRWRWVIPFGVALFVTVFCVEQAELLGLHGGRFTGWRDSAHDAIPFLPQADPYYPDQYTSGHEGEDESGRMGAVPFRAEGRILITGGGGNLGKHLIRRFLPMRTPITVIDKIFFPEELQAIRHDFPRSESTFRVVLGDIRDKEVLRSALTPDVVGVIHLAAVSRVQWCLENEPDCVDINVGGTGAVLEAIEGMDRTPWYIQASSREVYGNVESFPVTEDAPHKPANVYGSSKARAEDVLERFVTERNGEGTADPFHAIALRMSNIYGGQADHRERLIPSIMTNALAHRTIHMVGGAQDLDMIHIDDVVDAFALAITRLEKMSGRHWFDNLLGESKEEKSVLEIFNIAAGASTPAIELIRKILAIARSASPLQTIPGDARYPDNYVGSTTKAEEVLSFKARVSIDEGIQRLALAYLGETESYLERKLANECPPRSNYTINDVLSLDGCTGTLAVQGPGQIGYLFQNTEESDPSSRWGWRDDVEPQTWLFDVQPHGDADEAVLRLSQTGTQGLERFYEFLDDDQVIGEGSTRFVVSVDRTTGYISLVPASSGEPFTPPYIEMKPVIGRRQVSGSHPFRLTPFCCPLKKSPWPFFREDPLASAINDFRFETVRDFTASPMNTMCRRLQEALDVARTKIERIKGMSKPIQLEQAPLPTGSASEWRHSGMPVCTNLCDHPTVCLDTGACACAQASCISRVRFPFAAFANLPGLSFPPPTLDWAALSVHDPDILVNQVAQSSWLNVIRPHAARYLSRQPEFPNINLTRLPDEVQGDRDANPVDYDQVHSTNFGCFSADSVMERGVKLISSEYTSDSLVFLPYYAGTKMFPPFDQWANNALQHHLPPDFDSTRLIAPFMFDWGVCNTVLRTLFMVRVHSSPLVEMAKGTSWSPMGDINGPCYRMDQDIVVPARTCLQEELREAFGDIARVRPIHQRSVLLTFKGSMPGQGASIRQKVTCDRTYRDIVKPILEGGTSLARYWNEYKPGTDYLETMNDTVFCPLPRGTTGWSTRMTDAIWAGCIPVLIGDQTHHPLWDTLDWSRFSVQVHDRDLDHLESILLSHTWVELQRLQTNLMLIRDAFLYPAEGDMGANLRERGPFFFAMHGTALLRRTVFPT